MLCVPRIDFGPDGHSRPLSDREVADFRASGISAMHNSVGVGSKADALTFLAMQHGFAGRNSELFDLVDVAADLDRAKVAGRIAMIMGLQNASPFEAVEDVAFFHGLGLATKLQDLALSNDGLVTNMVSFNVGVEIGQLLALGVMLIAFNLWRRSGAFMRYAFASNVALMAAGFVLAGFQLTGYVVA